PPWRNTGADRAGTRALRVLSGAGTAQAAHEGRPYRFAAPYSRRQGAQARPAPFSLRPGTGGELGSRSTWHDEPISSAPGQREVFHMTEPGRVFEMLVAWLEPVVGNAPVPLGQRDP